MKMLAKSAPNATRLQRALWWFVPCVTVRAHAVTSYARETIRRVEYKFRALTCGKWCDFSRVGCQFEFCIIAASARACIKLHVPC